jgi:hypothetical protein
MLPGQAQAYLFVPLALLLACAAVLADERGAGEVLLAPGRSLTFYDAAKPGPGVVVTSPADAYINLSRLVPAIEKSGIHWIVTGLQVKSAGNLASNADGSMSLRPAPAHSYFVPKNAAPGPGRVTVMGGTAVLDKGQVVFRAERIQDSAASPPGPAPN